MPEDIHETIIIELYSLLSLLLCEAGLKRSIFAVKVSPFSGEYGGAQRRGHTGLRRKGCKPLLVRSTNL